MEHFLYFNSRDEFLRLDISKIMYFKADGNYTTIIMSNKLKATVGLSLSQMEKYLSESLHDKARSFVRIGKSCILNVNHIVRIDVPHQFVIVTDYTQGGYQISVSKEALRVLKSIMMQSLTRQKETEKQLNI